MFRQHFRYNKGKGALVILGANCNFDKTDTWVLAWGHVSVSIDTTDYTLKIAWLKEKTNVSYDRNFTLDNSNMNPFVCEHK